MLWDRSSQDKDCKPLHSRAGNNKTCRAPNSQRHHLNTAFATNWARCSGLIASRSTCHGNFWNLLNGNHAFEFGHDIPLENTVRACLRQVVHRRWPWRHAHTEGTAEHQLMVETYGSDLLQLARRWLTAKTSEAFLCASSPSKADNMLQCQKWYFSKN